jgi:serine/threonine-protein kinase
VFRASEPGEDRHDSAVAVKVFDLNLPPDLTHRLVGELETLIAADLAHPAIAAPLAAGVAGASAYLAQELIAAESLDVVLRDYGAAPPADAVRIATQIAGALDFAAVVGVFHGGLHPRDVLLSPDETRITGLGVAQALERLDVACPVRRPYTAPERLAGGLWNHRADVYSLAALIYELLWARRVAGSGDEAAAAAGVIDEADMPALRRVFARALAENPADRFETALGFVGELAGALLRAGAGPPQAGAGDRFEAASSSAAAGTEGVAPVHESVQAIETTPAADDLVLRAEEGAGHDDVEPVPALLAKRQLPGGGQGSDQNVSERFLTTSDLAPPARQPGIRPLTVALAAMFVLAFGFIIGRYTDVWRPVVPDTEPVPSSAAANAEGASVATSGTPTREFTETAVAGPTEPAVPIQAPTPSATASASPIARSSASPTAPESPDGRLLVRSTPASARVKLDGRDVGVTPLALRELAFGTHTVRVARDGYRSEERRVVLSSGRPSESLTFELSRADVPARSSSRAVAPPPQGSAISRFTGTLIVESRPAGARVFLDGKPIGTTPLTARDVPAGAHAVWLERDGYRRWTASIRVVTGERARVAASLER